MKKLEDLDFMLSDIGMENMFEMFLKEVEYGNSLEQEPFADPIRENLSHTHHQLQISVWCIALRIILIPFIYIQGKVT